MLLDDLLSVYHFRAAHHVVTRAPPERLFLAIREITPSEIWLLQFLFWVRYLPARLAGKPRLAVKSSRPFEEQMLDAGFVLLAEVPDHEMVVGAIGQFWKLWAGPPARLGSAQEFLTFPESGHAKAAINFRVEPGGGDQRYKLSTETRIYVPDQGIRWKFALYWRLIYPGISLIRRSLLLGIKRRAEGARNELPSGGLDA